MKDQKRNFEVRTPGEPVPPKQMPPQESDAPKENPAFTEDQLIAIEAEVQRRLREERRRALNKQTVVDLPTADSVDITKEKRPVLTRDGWLVPPSENKGLK